MYMHTWQQACGAWCASACLRHQRQQWWRCIEQQVRFLVNQAVQQVGGGGGDLRGSRVEQRGVQGACWMCC